MNLTRIRDSQTLINSMSNLKSLSSADTGWRNHNQKQSRINLRWPQRCPKPAGQQKILLKIVKTKSIQSWPLTHPMGKERSRHHYFICYLYKASVGVLIKTFIYLFGFLNGFGRCKEHLSPDLGLLKMLKVLDWGLAYWSWFVYGYWSVIHWCS